MEALYAEISPYYEGESITKQPKGGRTKARDFQKTSKYDKMQRIKRNVIQMERITSIHTSKQRKFKSNHLIKAHRRIKNSQEYAKNKRQNEIDMANAKLAAKLVAIRLNQSRLHDITKHHRDNGGFCSRASNSINTPSTVGHADNKRTTASILRQRRLQEIGRENAKIAKRIREISLDPINRYQFDANPQYPHTRHRDRTVIKSMHGTNHYPLSFHLKRDAEKRREKRERRKEKERPLLRQKKFHHLNSQPTPPQEPKPENARSPPHSELSSQTPSHTHPPLQFDLPPRHAKEPPHAYDQYQYRHQYSQPSQPSPHHHFHQHYQLPSYPSFSANPPPLPPSNHQQQHPYPHHMYHPHLESHAHMHTQPVHNTVPYPFPPPSG